MTSFALCRQHEQPAKNYGKDYVGTAALGCPLKRSSTRLCDCSWQTRPRIPEAPRR